MALYFLHNPRRMKLKDGQGHLAPTQQPITNPSLALQPQLVSNVRLMNNSMAGNQMYPTVGYQPYPQMVLQSPYPQVQYPQNVIPTQYAAAVQPVIYPTQQVYYAWVIVICMHTW